MQMTPYLAFDGDCREAFEFYAKTLGGEIDMMLTYGESPISDDMPSEIHEHVMHAGMVAEGAMLMGCDVPSGHYEKPQGIMIALEIDDIAKAERIFNALAEGGKVTMPWEETFWVERFGMLNDRYGIMWAVNGGKSRME